jgi:hypothetical protein
MCYALSYVVTNGVFRGIKCGITGVDSKDKGAIEPFARCAYSSFKRKGCMTLWARAVSEVGQFVTNTATQPAGVIRVN